MKDSNYNQQKAEAFSGSLVEVLNKSAIALALSIGDRCGLFKVMADLPASTSQQIADAANLNERYVREWLGALVTGRVVNYYPETQTYQLPAEHAAYLTDEGEYNFASAMQFIPVMAGVENDIVECFRSGGGVPYSKYTRFHEVMAKESTQTTVNALEPFILPLVPGLKEKLEAGIDVLDVGCGSGRAMIKLASLYPNSRFTGYDVSEEGIARANAEAASVGLPNARFEVRDAAAIGEDAAYDLITSFDAIHDQADPAAMLAGIARALRPDGVYLVQDISGSSYLQNNLDHPAAPYMYTISLTHCMTVSLSCGGAGLGAMWGEEKCVEMLNEAGFPNVKLHKLDHDFINTYYIARNQ
jgi:2-polyprenyl-3-methyl-5-hydroxy-6-metoxy-1,4-benzoquinol methylase